MVRGRSRDEFRLVMFCGSRNGGLPMNRLRFGTALFSFEGMNLDRSSRKRLRTIEAVPSSIACTRRDSHTHAISRASDAAIGREILENCIEKNFHVSRHMKAASCIIT